MSSDASLTLFESQAGESPTCVGTAYGLTTPSGRISAFGGILLIDYERIERANRNLALRELRALDSLSIVGGLIEGLVDAHPWREHPRGARHTRDVVYFVQVGADGPVKIGKSKEHGMGNRLISLQGGNHEPLVVRRVVYGGKPLEAQLHAHFAEHQVRPGSEWFWPCDELVTLMAASPREPWTTASVRNAELVGAAA